MQSCERNGEIVRIVQTKSATKTLEKNIINKKEKNTKKIRIMDFFSYTPEFPSVFWVGIAAIEMTKMAQNDPKNVFFGKKVAFL